MIYVYGLDLAQTLNYFACYVLAVDKKVKIKTIVKKKDIMYPELEEMMLTKLFPKYPPKKIVTDYTSERAFSEWLERRLHPSFANPSSKEHKKWKYVVPIVSTDVTNLEMKQNARQMMNDELFIWPPLSQVPPRIAKLIEETKEQMYREAGEPSKGNAALKFPKPRGYDNDLIRALELGLLKSRDYLGHMSGTGGIPVVVGKKIGPNEKEPEKPFRDLIKKKLAGFNVTGTDFKWASQASNNTSEEAICWIKRNLNLNPLLLVKTLLKKCYKLQNLRI